MVSKKSLGTKLNKIFEEAGKTGVNPSNSLDRMVPINWDQVRKTLSSWEAKGKITCIEERYPINHSKYVLTKYVRN